MNTFQDLKKRPRLNHDTPFWVRESDEIFFVTVCRQGRGGSDLSEPKIAGGLLESVRHRNESGRWRCSAFVVMPDHAHGLIQFHPAEPMQQAMKAWKSWTARSLKVRWQNQWFDHRLRGDEEWRRKADYLFNNGVRAGLVADPLEWPWRFLDER